MRNVLFSATAALALSLFATGAYAADVEPAPEPTGGLFGHISGSYLFEDAIRDWRLFDNPPPGDSTSKESFGDGYAIDGRLGYRWSEWDFAIGGQFADFSKGDASTAEGDVGSGTLEADMWFVDAQAGYNFAMGDTAARTALGIRYAEWDHTVDPGGDREVTHDWWGVGPRFEVNTDSPLSESLSLLFDGGIGVLFGKIKTDSSGSWICDDCSDENTTSINADARLGLGWAITPGAKLVAGYQVQYWSDVNVAATDTTGRGGNEGESDHLIHGPFGSIVFDFSK